MAPFVGHTAIYLAAVPLLRAGVVLRHSVDPTVGQGRHNRNGGERGDRRMKSGKKLAACVLGRQSRRAIIVVGVVLVMAATASGVLGAAGAGVSVGHSGWFLGQSAASGK